MINFKTKDEVCQQMAAAIKSDDEQTVAQAWKDYHDSLAQQLRADFEAAQAAQDENVLVERGYRRLTQKETRFYEKLSNALKSANPKQAFAEIISSTNEEDLMPQTIIEDVFKGLREKHELLQVINFQYVGYLTKWILNDHAAQKATWGAITDAIAKEITTGFKVIDIHQNKLSAFAFIERGVLDLGPIFLDAYIRTCLEEAIMCGLEYGIVMGTGVKEPVGLIRDIHEGATFSTTDGYSAKEKVAITKINPETYGALLATLAKTEDGKDRAFNEVVVIVNQKTYLKRLLPATKVMAADGRYVSMLDSVFPTKIIISNFVEDDDAVLFLPDEYFFGVGSGRNGAIEYSDDFKFLDDVRYFKIVQYGAGRCYDNTSAIYLDISGLEPARIPVDFVTSTTVA